MEPFWILVGFSVVVVNLYFMINQNHRIKVDKSERELQRSYTDKAAQENPEIVGLHWDRNRKLVEKELRPKILSRTGGKCFYCDIKLSSEPQWQVDHVWPHRYGGSEEMINLVPACVLCNENKWSYLPPRYLLHKWVVGKEFTVHELRFLDYYKANSMANLIGTSAHWKGMADYWHATIFRDFVDLIIQNESIKKTSGKRRKELIKKAQYIYKKLDCDVARRVITGRFSVIEDWLETDKFIEEYKKETKFD